MKKDEIFGWLILIGIFAVGGAMGAGLGWYVRGDSSSTSHQVAECWFACVENGHIAAVAGKSCYCGNGAHFEDPKLPQKEEEEDEDGK